MASHLVRPAQSLPTASLLPFLLRPPWDRRRIGTRIAALGVPVVHLERSAEATSATPARLWPSHPASVALPNASAGGCDHDAQKVCIDQEVLTL